MTDRKKTAIIIESAGALAAVVVFILILVEKF